MDYSAWNLDTLKAEFVRLGQEYAVIGTTRNAILKEIQFREKQAIAQMRLRAMPEPIKDALRDALAKR